MADEEVARPDTALLPRKPGTDTHLTVAGTGIEFGVGLGVDPQEILDRIVVTVVYVADGHGPGFLADVPDGHLSARQAAGQPVFALMVELEFDNRIL